MSKFNESTMGRFAEIMAQIQEGGAGSGRYPRDPSNPNSRYYTGAGRIKPGGVAGKAEPVKHKGRWVHPEDLPAAPRRGPERQPPSADELSAKIKATRRAILAKQSRGGDSGPLISKLAMLQAVLDKLEGRPEKPGAGSLLKLAKSRGLRARTPFDNKEAEKKSLAALSKPPMTDKEVAGFEKKYGITGVMGKKHAAGVARAQKGATKRAMNVAYRNRLSGAAARELANARKAFRVARKVRRGNPLETPWQP